MYTPSTLIKGLNIFILIPCDFQRICFTVCDGQHYGKDCKVDCQCKVEYTKKCDSITGKCSCKKGYHGKKCEHGKWNLCA